MYTSFQKINAGKKKSMFKMSMILWDGVSHFSRKILLIEVSAIMCLNCFSIERAVFPLCGTQNAIQDRRRAALHSEAGCRAGRPRWLSLSSRWTAPGALAPSHQQRATSSSCRRYRQREAAACGLYLHEISDPAAQCVW